PPEGALVPYRPREGPASSPRFIVAGCIGHKATIATPQKFRREPLWNRFPVDFADRVFWVRVTQFGIPLDIPGGCAMRPQTVSCSSTTEVCSSIGSARADVALPTRMCRGERTDAKRTERGAGIAGSARKVGVARALGERSSLREIPTLRNSLGVSMGLRTEGLLERH